MYRILLFMLFITNIFCNRFLFISNKYFYTNKKYTFNFYSTYNKNKDILILDENMPILYSKIYVSNLFLKNNIYSIEHIYPVSFINPKKKNLISTDMHNLIKTTKYLNNARSNYKFVDLNNITNKNLWLHLDNNNFVNHKKKLFIPSENSKGFISRAIIYMYHKYNFNCNFKKIIDTNTLIEWYYKYPPTKSEIYHNNIIKKIQYTDNIFISKYNKINICNILKKND